MRRFARRRPNLTGVLVVATAGMVTWGFDQHQSTERVAERRRSDAVICAFLNDTRAEVVGVVKDFTDAPTTAAALSPELRALVDASRAATKERAAAAQRRLAPYDCAAFVRGELPSRTPG